MKKRKRYGPVGSSYNSKKYLAMHNQNISEGLKRYHRHKRGEYTKEEIKSQAICMILFIAISVIVIYALSFNP